MLDDCCGVAVTRGDHLERALREGWATTNLVDVSVGDRHAVAHERSAPKLDLIAELGGHLRVRVNARLGGSTTL
jgi:hypothetical protein